jgi:hypothetical protein
MIGPVTGTVTAAFRSMTAARLRARREEIYDAVIHRALSVAPPSGKEAPGYVEALRASIPTAVEYAFEVIEVGEERAGPTPAAILIQAASSARSGVGLEVVMRRYAAGYSILSDFLHQEMRALATAFDPGYGDLQRELTALFDRLVVEVSGAYRREEEGRSISSPRQRQLERIRRLLAGELVDTARLEYPLECLHLAMIVMSHEPGQAAEGLAGLLDRRLLIGESSAGRCAVWLGGSRPIDGEVLDRATAVLVQEGHRFAIGEPGEGLGGWRRSRRQAEAAYLVAQLGELGVTRYRDVSLVAAAIRDPDLASYLKEAFVDPLGEDRLALAATLETFFQLNGNASSTAAALGVSRQTVASRIRAVETRLQRPLDSCVAQLDTALRLAALGMWSQR